MVEKNESLITTQKEDRTQKLFREAMKREHTNKIVNDLRLLRDKHRLPKEYSTAFYPADFFKLGHKKEEKVYKVFFHKKNTRSYHVARAIVDEIACEHHILKNFDDDKDTVNHVAIFTHNQLDDLAFFYYLIWDNKVGDENISGYSLFGVNLNQFHNIRTGQINWSKIFGEPLPKISDIDNKTTYMVDSLIKHYKWSEEEVEEYLLLKYLVPLKIEHLYTSHKINEKLKISFLSDPSGEYRLRKDRIYSDLVRNGLVSIKWKSEYSLYMMVVEYFPDSLFQHFPKELFGLSYDIFIPSHKVAIEYQGIQHYEPIDIFGGEEKFEWRQHNDEEKRKLSQANGIQLIEWKYDLAISKENLIKKFQEKGILVN